MFVWRYVHRIEEPPTIAISSRWSMVEATKSYIQIEDGTASIDTTTNTISLKTADRSYAISSPTLNN
ncbi:hypothetical protein PHMEG_00020797 [Phytophthora megakarya]|uniref:Uncharacterized protein n=1 Tax=Phytophthora megakarya TaxID=4795 RepID=A0A225VQ39_9STRA|nr:hypothetical protein PHMEG_00020797 [Phytophthora megakarya]